MVLLNLIRAETQAPASVLRVTTPRLNAALPKGERGANDNPSSDSFDATAISIATFFGVGIIAGAVGLVACFAKLGWL